MMGFQAKDYFDPRLKVLIIDQDVVFARQNCQYVSRFGMSALAVCTGAGGIEARAYFSPDIVFLTPYLSDMSVDALIGAFSELTNCGIIVMSELPHEADWIVWLESGADDCVEKAMGLRELLARTRAVARRCRNILLTDRENSQDLKLHFGEIDFDLIRHTIQSATTHAIMLTGAEFGALKIMLAANNTVVSRDSLSIASFQKAYTAYDRSVDQLIFNLRRKLMMLGTSRVLHSVRGGGYLLSTSNNAFVTPLSY